MRRVLDSPTGWLNQTEAEFVRLSVVRKKRLLVGTVSAVSVAFVVLSVLTLIAYYEQGRAVKGEAAALKSEGKAKEQTLIAQKKERVANSRRLASLSESQSNVRLDRSLLLAVEALNLENTFEARDSLYRALQGRPGLESFFHVTEGETTSVALSPDGKTLATGYKVFTGDGGLVLWDLATRSRLAELKVRQADEGNIKRVVFSPDGRTIAAVCEFLARTGLILWDTGTRTRLTEHKLQVPLESRLDAIAFSPDAGSIAGGYSKDGNSGGGVMIWDLATGERSETQPLLLTAGFIQSIAFRSEGRTIAAVYQSSVDVKITSGLFVVGAPVPGQPQPSQAGGAATTGGLIQWDVATGMRLMDQPLPGSEGDIQSMVFRSDGEVIAAGYGLGGIRDAQRTDRGGLLFWEVPTAKRLVDQPWVLEEGAIVGLSFSRDGKSIAAGCQSFPVSGVVVLDLASGRRLADRPLTAQGGTPRSVALGADGRTLAANYGGGSKETGYDSGAMLWRFPAHVRLLNDSVPPPRGRKVPTGTAAFSLKLNGADAPLGLTLVGQPDNVAFSPDGKTVAASYDKYGLVLWNFATGRSLREEPLRSGTDDSLCFAFSPDGVGRGQEGSHFRGPKRASYRAAESELITGMRTPAWWQRSGAALCRGKRCSRAHRSSWFP